MTYSVMSESRVAAFSSPDANIVSITENVLQNGVNALSKLVNHILLKKLSFVKFEPYNFVQISPSACGPSTYQILNV